MEMDDILAARALMQVVHILRDNGQVGDVLCKLSNGGMSGIRLRMNNS